MGEPFYPGYFETAQLNAMGFGSIGKNVSISTDCTIINRQNIFIGSHVRIDGNTVIIAGKNEKITFGHYIHIGGCCHLSGSFGITLHDFSGLSQGVKLYSATDDYSGGSFTNPMVPSEYTIVRAKAIEVGKHCIVGAGSVILPGVTMGDGSSAGALSVIRKSTKPWKVYVGNPAKELTKRKIIDPTGEIEQKLLAAV